MGECDACGRPAYLTILYTEGGQLIGRYGRECAHRQVRALAAEGTAAYRAGGRRVWVRPGRQRRG